MGIIKTETFINEDGVEMRKDTYANGMTITQMANPPEPEPTPEPQPTQLDRIEATVNSIASGTDENTAAMNALLGV